MIALPCVRADNQSALCDGAIGMAVPGPIGAMIASAGVQGSRLLQVSSSGKPLHYFVELSKRFLQEHGEVQLSAIGLAIPQAVNVSQILTTSGYATELRECPAPLVRRPRPTQSRGQLQ